MPINYTRAQLEGFLNSGQSVLVNGRHIDRLADLPAESELAVGDRERARAALEAHDEQIAHLVAERRKLAHVAEGEAKVPPAGVGGNPPATPLRPANAPGAPDQDDLEAVRRRAVAADDLQRQLDETRAQLEEARRRAESQAPSAPEQAQPAAEPPEPSPPAEPEEGKGLFGRKKR